MQLTTQMFAIMEDGGSRLDVFLLVVGVLGLLAVVPLAIGLLFRPIRRVASWLLLIDLMGLGIMYVTGMLFGGKSHNLKPSCSYSLHRIDMACALYEMDTGMRPTNSAVLSNFCEPKFFVCPLSKQKPGDMTNVDQWATHVLRPGATNLDDVSIYCSNTNHGGVEILLGDHSSKLIPRDEFDRLMKAGTRTTNSGVAGAPPSK